MIQSEASSTPHGAATPWRELGIFLGLFTMVWVAAVIVVWRLEWIGEGYRPWLRTALWCGAVAIWVRWQNYDAPLRRLGLVPVSLRIVAYSALAFAAVLAWNELRIHVVDPPLGRLSTLSLSGLVWSIVGVFVEELMFRGVVQTRLAERLSAPRAIVLTSLLFTAIHVPGWYILSIPVNASIVVSIFLIGALCGWLRHRSRSLWPAVTAHWANNLGAML